MKENKLVTVFFLAFLMGCIIHSAEARPAYTINFIDGANKEAGVQEFQGQIKEEINALMKSRADIRYRIRTVPVSCRAQTSRAIDSLIKNTAADCFIGVGVEITDRLIRQKSYPKPVIAVGVLDAKLQGIARTSKNTSGLHNFNYIESHFDVEKDLKAFKSLYDYKHLAVVLLKDDITIVNTIHTYFSRILKNISPDSTFSIIRIDPDNITKGIPQIPLDADAVYLVPVFSKKGDQQMADIIREINNRKLPSFAMIGETHVRLGAMASIAPARKVNAMARRIAINVLEILEGRDPATLPVTISRYADNFVINVETLKKLDFYPPWDAVGDARSIYLEKLHSTGPGLQLRQVIFEALERNLDYLSSRTETQIQEQEAGMAGAALLPQINLSAGVTRIDANRVNISQTYPAQTTILATAGLTQTVFSDDILANRAIQKILTQSQRFEEKAAKLDTVLTAASAYINMLLATSTQTIHNDNLSVTRKNLEIARNKEAVGTVNAAEVSRWESEMAANQISLNDAYRDFETARMNLNQVLDQPITRDFTLEDVGPDKGIELMITDPDVFTLLGDYKKIRKFSDFLVLEADRYLPEFQQIRENIKAREREVLNRKRAMFLPDVAIQGTADKILEEYDAREKTISDLDHPWSVSVTASWPLFTGGADKKDLARAKYRLRYQQLQEKNLVNRLHLDIRSKLETAAVSAREIELSEKRYAAAKKSFEIFQAGYAEGRNSVTELVDAQNTKLNSERALAAARYQFVLDFLEMERAMGQFYFLSDPGEKQAFLGRLKEYMQTTPTKKSQEK